MPIRNNMTIQNKLKALSEAFHLLAEANRTYLANPARANVESFRNLIDQRAVIGEDIELMSRQLVSETDQKFRGNTFSCQNVVEVIRALPVIAPEMSGACQLLKDSLNELVNSDKLVEAEVEKMRDEIKGEIARIRKGSQGLKGYRQIETLGSCFINKVK